MKDSQDEIPKILGCPCLPITVAEARVILHELILENAAGFTCAVNMAKIHMATEDKKFAELVGKSILPYPDGSGAVFGLRLASGLRSERVDLQKLVIEACEIHDKPLMLLGGEPGIHRIAEARLKREFPSLQIVPGGHGFGDLSQYESHIKAFAPSVVLLGLGSPLQENIAQALAGSTSSLIIPSGGAIDVMAGASVRAPETWRALHLEWLWRAARQPSRFLKLRILPIFLFRLMVASALRGCATLIRIR